MSLNTLQVAALYVAVYNRAPDAAGLTYWTTDFTGSYADAAAGFVSHPLFVQDYANLTKQQIVEKFYTNILGSAGDTAGIDYWVARLEAGEDMGLVLSEFINATLTGDFTGDSAALARQATLVNKSEVGIYYAEKLGAKTNMDAATYDPASVNVANDPAFIAGKNAIATVTDNASSVTVAKDAINKLSPDNTFTLTEHADIATANVFDAPQVYTPAGNDRINSLQNDDVLTGTGDNPTLNAVLGNPGDNGNAVITPTLTGIETINARFDAQAAMVLDLQDATGVKNINITRVADDQNAMVRNIADPVEALSVANSQAPDGDITFNFLNKAVSGADDTVELALSNVDVNRIIVQERGNTPADGFETINLVSTGSENEVNFLRAEDLQTLNISGDQDLTLGGETVVVRGDGAVEAVRTQAALENVAGSLSKIDASEFEGDLQITLGAEINAGQDGTSGKAVEFEFIGGKGDDTIVLASTVVGGAVGNTDKIDGGEGENTLIVTGGTTINAGGTAAAPVANVTNIQALAILSGHENGVGGDTVNINADAFDSLSSIYVRNEGQTFDAVDNRWESAAEGMTVNLTNLTSDQANGITLAHGTTGNSTIANNIVNIGLKTATGAADTASVTIVDGVNTDPVFNAQIAAAAVERVTLVDSDTESNTIHLNQGTFTQAGSSITVNGGAAGQYMSLDSFGGAAPLGAGAQAGYGYATDGTAGSSTTVAAAPTAAIPGVPTAVSTSARDNAVSTVFNGTAGIAGPAGDLATRHVVENIDASEYAGDFVVRVGELTRADGTTSMNIKTGAGNDTVIFDAIGSTSAGFSSGDTVAMGAGTDTLVLDGNTATIPGTPRVNVATSEWDNLSGVDVLRFGNNAGVANVGIAAPAAQVANNGGAYYVHIDNDFISQTDDGNRLTIVNNDGRLDTNTESDAVVDLRGLSQSKFVTFVGANGVGGAGISSNRIVLDDISANAGQILDGGDTDVRVNTTAGYQAGNNNVYEVRNSANVSLNDLANVKNFGRIEFFNDQAVAQTLTLTLNNAVVESLVDASKTATSAATQEILNIAAAPLLLGGGAAVLNIDARAVDLFHALNVTGTSGADVITLNSNLGGSASTLDFAAVAGGADRVNWTGGNAAATVAIDLSTPLPTSTQTHAFTLGGSIVTHNSLGVDIVDISGMSYSTATIIGSANADTIIGGAGNDIINGGAGVDTITTGAGADRVVLASVSADRDVVTDFTVGTGNDTIQLTAANTTAGTAAGTAPVVATDTTVASTGTVPYGLGGITTTTTDVIVLQNGAALTTGTNGGDLSLTTAAGLDGTELLKALTDNTLADTYTEITTDAGSDAAYLVAYQGGNAYIYLASDTSGDSAWQAAEIQLVGTLQNVAANGLVADNYAVLA